MDCIFSYVCPPLATHEYIPLYSTDNSFTKKHGKYNCISSRMDIMDMRSKSWFSYVLILSDSSVHGKSGGLLTIGYNKLFVSNVLGGYQAMVF